MSTRPPALFDPAELCQAFDALNLAARTFIDGISAMAVHLAGAMRELDESLKAAVVADQAKAEARGAAYADTPVGRLREAMAPILATAAPKVATPAPDLPLRNARPVSIPFTKTDIGQVPWSEDRVALLRSLDGLYGCAAMKARLNALPGRILTDSAVTKKAFVLRVRLARRGPGRPISVPTPTVTPTPAPTPPKPAAAPRLVAATPRPAPTPLAVPRLPPALPCARPAPIVVRPIETKPLPKPSAPARPIVSRPGRPFVDLGAQTPRATVEATIDEMHVWMRGKGYPAGTARVGDINAKRRLHREPEYRLVVQADIVGIRNWAQAHDLPPDAALTTINAARRRCNPPLPPYTLIVRAEHTCVAGGNFVEASPHD